MAHPFEHRKGIKMPVHIKHFTDKALENSVIAKVSAIRPFTASQLLYLSDKLHLQEYGR
jgi:hypothetical protein